MSTIVGASFAQLATEPATSRVVNDILNPTRLNPVKANSNSNKALGTEFYSNDFSTSSDWTIVNSGQTAADFGWSIGTVTNSWYFGSGINSTSGGNYAVVNNGNAVNGTQATGVEYTMTTTSAIDVLSLGGSSSAILKFQQTGARFNDDQLVQISTDGNNFTTVYDNGDLPATVSGDNNDYVNPMDVSVNISSVLAAGNASTVWIRFTWTSVDPQSTNPNLWIAYGWFIDDVSLTSLPDNDLVVTDAVWGAPSSIFGLVEYSMIPTTQVTDYSFAAFVSNEGVNDADNATLTVTANTGGYSGTASAVTIPAGYVDSVLEVAPVFSVPATLQSYQIDWALTSDVADDVPANNAIAPSIFDVTEFIYAKDNDVIEGTINYAGDNPVEVGNIFTCFSAEQLHAIDFVVGNGTDAGAEVLVHLYEVTVVGGALDYNKVASSTLEYTITPADVASNATVSVKLGSPYSLVAGTDYMVSVEGYGGAGTAFAVANSGSHVGAYSENGDPFARYIDVNPMIRMNFENALATTASFTTSANPICKGDVVTFNSTSTGGVAPYTFSWNFGDGSTSNLANDTHTFSVSGPQSVTFTVTDDTAPTQQTATETLTFNVGNCFTAIDENSLNTVLVSQNMPNPFNERSVVNFELASSEAVTFEILDVTGKLVRTINLGNLNSGAHSIEVDAKELNSGVYYYSIITGNSKVTNKMVVKK